MIATMTDRWFEPARFYERGYPIGTSSALRLFDGLRERLVEKIRAKDRMTLEVGPGDRPLALGRRAFYVDRAPFFLRARSHATCADVAALPFRSRAFDLAIASDVLTHVPPPRRFAAILELQRVASRVAVFNPEFSADPENDETRVDTKFIVYALRTLSSREPSVEQYVVEVPGDPRVFRMALVTSS